MRIGVIGLGYVGLPVCVRFAESGVNVLGIDVDEKKVENINRGRSYIKHIKSSHIESLVKKKTFRASTNIGEISNCDAVIICVPTPLSRNREPDLRYVFSIGKGIAPHIQNGMTIVLESTTYPGTTDEELRMILEEGSGKKAGLDFHLAYSPEREDPGNDHSQMKKIPKIVGGYTTECCEKASELYEMAVDEIVPVSNCRVAEATKLLENIFRSVNIALVNELKVIYEKMGIDIWEVITAAKTKPFGFKAFYPGPGLGGHCIPIDPFYLTWKARQYDIPTRFIELAGEVNTLMPHYVVQKTADSLNDKCKSLNGSKILIIGLAYKAEVDDDRESPSYQLIRLFTEKKAVVHYYDPHIPIIKPSREHANLSGQKSIKWNRENVSMYDVVVIVTAHSVIDYTQLSEWANCIIDTRNVMKAKAVKEAKIIKA